MNWSKMKGNDVEEDSQEAEVVLEETILSQRRMELLQKRKKKLKATYHTHTGTSRGCGRWGSGRSRGSNGNHSPDCGTH
jgi:hypothetical protein